MLEKKYFIIRIPKLFIDIKYKKKYKSKIIDTENDEKVLNCLFFV